MGIKRHQRWLHWLLFCALLTGLLPPAQPSWAQEPPTVDDATVTGRRVYLPLIQHNAGATITEDAPPDAGSDDPVIDDGLVVLASADARFTSACDLYPLALHSQTLTNVTPGTLLNDILHGNQPGNFGWLSWAGDNGVQSLVTGLTPPGNASTYTNPHDPTDHKVSIGDWVRGRPGVANAVAVRNALDKLKSIDMSVPVWGTTQGNGANTQYQLVDFALVRLTDYRLPGQNRISARFLGYNLHCRDNTPPLAADDAYTLAEDAILTVPAPGVLVNDSDAQQQPLRATVVRATNHGLVTLKADGAFVYTPTLHFNGQDHFTYQANDGLLNSTIATVTLTITSSNDPPIAHDDSVATDEDTPILIGVRANDSAGPPDEEQSLAVTALGMATNGVVETAVGGDVRYTPAPNFNGADTFTYTICDSGNLCATATVTVVIGGVNDPPVATDDQATTPEETLVTIDVAANDSDPDGNLMPSSALTLTNPARGVVAVVGAGRFTYTPNANYNGPDQFRYTICDDGAPDGVPLCANATVTIAVTPVNDAPVAAADFYTATEDTLFTVAAPGLLGNDQDVDGDLLTVKTFTQPAHGALTQQPDGGLSYLPNADYCGADSYSYTATDGQIDAAATVTLTITCVNDPPLAQDDVYAVNEDESLTVSAPGLLGNDQDPDGDPLAVQNHTQPAHGVLTQTSDGALVYTPQPNFCGADSYVYTVVDGKGGSAEATVMLTVACVNYPPLAVADNYAVDAGQTLAVAAPGVIGNDSDVDGDTLTALLVNSPAHGTVVLSANGTLVYTPTVGFSGTDAFTYKVNDGQIDSNIATITIIINQINNAPIAADDFYTKTLTNSATYTIELKSSSSTLASGLGSGAPSGTLLSRLDTADISGLTFSPVAVGAFGTVTPLPTDAPQGTVVINIAPGNGQNGYFKTTFELPQVFTNPQLVGVANVDDLGRAFLNGNPISPSIAQSQLPPITQFGNVRFSTANPTFFKSGVNELVISDANTGSGPSGAAFYTHITFTTNAVQLSIAAPGILTNDSDPDGDPLTAMLVSTPMHGTVTLSLDGALRYTPTLDYHGPDSFTYKANDGQLDSNIATVSLTVAPVNDRPTAVGDSYSVAEGNTLAVAAPGVLTNDSDVEGSPLTATVVDLPINGTVTLDPDGAFSYTPNAGFFGVDSFTYRVNDGALDSNIATVEITINQTARCLPAPEGMVSWWTGDGDASDYIGGNHGVTHGDTAFIAGHVDQAFVLDGTGDYVEIADSPTLSLNGLLSVDAWIYPLGGSGGLVTKSDNAASGSVHWSLQYDGTGHRVAFSITSKDGTFTRIFSPDSSVSLNTWSHIAATVDGTIIKLFVNGTEVSTGQSPGLAPNRFTLLLGAYQRNGVKEQFFRGYIDEVALFNRSLTAIEVQRIYAAGVNGRCRGTPIVWDDGYTIDQDNTLAIPAPGVLGNDRDPDGNTLNAVHLSDPLHGALTLNTDGAFTYIPNPGFVGTDSFTYHASNGRFNSAIATVRIFIFSPQCRVGDWRVIPDLTTARYEHVAVLLHDGRILITGGTQAINAAGIDLTSTELYNPATNTWQLGPNLSMPRAAATGTLLPDGRVLIVGGEDRGTSLASAEIFDPITNTWTPAASMGTSRAGHTATLLKSGRVLVAGGATRAGSDPALSSAEIYDPATNTWLAAASMSAVRHVHTATLLNNGQVLVTGGYFVPHIQAAVNSAELYNPETNTWTILPTMSSPRAVHTALLLNNGRVLVTGGEHTAAWATSDLFDPTTNSWLTVPNMSMPRTRHTASLFPNGQVLVAGGVGTNASVSTELYDPMLNRWQPGANLKVARNLHSATQLCNGTILLAGGWNSSAALASVELYVPNGALPTAPVAVADNYSTLIGQTLMVDTPGVLTNDSDANGDPLIAALVSNPAHGTLTLNGNGGFVYTPTVDFIGNDTFTYKANDGQLDSNIVMVTITVDSPANLPPVANNDLDTLNEDTVLTVPAPGVLGNDNDPNGKSLTAHLVSTPAHGKLTLNVDGSYIYTPTIDFNGADSFTYKANNGQVDSNLATVNLTIASVNDAPVAVGYATTMPEDNYWVCPDPCLLRRVYDFDGDPLTVRVGDPPDHGTLDLRATGALTYTPYANFTGVDTFTFIANDGQIDSNTATITITVLPASDQPVAVSDSYSVGKDTTLTVKAPGVLANDSDPDGGVLTAALLSGPAHGTVKLEVNGSFIYTPTAGYSGADHFVYRARNANLFSAETLVTITVSGAPNQPPVAGNDTYNVTSNQSLTVAAPGVLANDNDPNGDSIRAVLFNSPANGTLALNPNGSFVYTPTVGFSGTDTFTYKANDSVLDSNIASVTLTVAPFSCTVGNWSAVPDLSTPRYGHVAVLLGDGRVLVTGGTEASTATGSDLTSTELYNPATNTWQSGPDLNRPRARATGTLLPDNRVLIVGGEDRGTGLASAEIFDPDTNTWVLASSMSTPRHGHTATLLKNGQVLVTGGATRANNDPALASAELYNPATNTWLPVASMSAVRYAHTATLLDNGNVLVTGGFPVPLTQSAVSSAELYNPETNTWTSLPAMSSPRGYHTALLLKNGRVLVTGGEHTTTLASSDLFDPTTNSWLTVPDLYESRVRHTASLLPTGQVLVAGGVAADSPNALRSAELYDSVSNRWQAGLNLKIARNFHTATLLCNGKILFVGGWDATKALVTTELYDPYGTIAANVSQIVLQSNRNGNWEIYLAKVETVNGQIKLIGGPYRLTNHPAADQWPTLSRDGRRIAFTSDRDGNLEIYVITIEYVGGIPRVIEAERRVTNYAGLDQRATWSPDGRWLVFTSGPSSGVADLYIVDPNDTVAISHERLTFQGAGHDWPVWSPDGAKIAYTRNPYAPFQSNINLLDIVIQSGTVTTGAIRSLTTSGMDDFPAWSSDGSKLAFNSGRDTGNSQNAEIYVMNADGSAVQRLTGNAVHDNGPTWSPDGKTIAYTCTGCTRPKIHTVDVANPPASSAVALIPGSFADLNVPSSWSVIPTGPATFVIAPNIVGQTRTTAESAIGAAGLTLGLVRREFTNTVPAGQVIRQSPNAGTSLFVGSAIHLVIAESSTDNHPPIANNDAATVNAGVVLNILAPGVLGNDSDPDGDALTARLVTGPTHGALTLNATGSYRYTPAAGYSGSDSFTYKANDGAADSNVATVSITVRPAINDTTPPTVAMTAPTADATITTLTDLTGTATDANFDHYEVAIAPVGQNSFTPIINSTTPVVDSKLGTLDPTLLLNDLYTVRLTAFDLAGNSAAVEIIVQIAGNQKIGNFTVAFEDLTIGTACLPLNINRVYDSRDRTPGDFGFGWRLDIQTLRLRESQTMGNGWFVDLVDEPGPFGILIPTYYLLDTGVHKVSLTLPDGHVEEFDLTPSPSRQQVSPILAVTPVYTPRPGTVGRLAAEGNPPLAILDGQPGVVDLLYEADLTRFDPQVYRYTAPDGTIYRIDKNRGLQSIECTTGATLTFGPNGIVHSTGQGLTLVRDAQQRIIEVSDPNGNLLRYEYDAAGNLIRFTDAGGNVTRFTYNDQHYLLEIIDPRGVQGIRNEYDTDGRLIGHTDANGAQISYIHDLVAKTETVTDRRGNSTVYEYDERGNVLRQTDALGNVTSYTYDAFDNELTVTDALGNTTTRTYDLRRNVLTEEDPLGNVTRFAYNAQNNVRTLTDALGRVTNYDYDGPGYLIRTTDALGNITRNLYDTGGIIIPGTWNLLAMTDALGNTTNYDYDNNGRLLKEIDAQGHTTAYTYDLNGNRLTESMTRTTDSGVVTVVTSFTYDVQNRLVKTTYPDGSTTQTEYNAIGQQSATVDQLARRTRYEYDLAGRLVKTTYPDGRFESSTYDEEGNRLTATDRAGRTTTFAYDKLNRLVRTVYPDGSATSSSYDAAGRVVATTDERGNSTRYEYDAAGRRTKVIDALGHATTFTYDANGNQRTMTDANGNTVTYEYDVLNRRTRTRFADGSSTLTTYDAVGRRVAERDQANKNSQFGYDALGRLVSVTDALGQVTRYSYDERGNQLTQTDANGRATSFGYDALGRRVRRTLPLGMAEAYTYNTVGNLISKTDFNGKTTTYAYDDLNRLLSRTPDPSLNEPTVRFAYFPSGQRQRMEDASGVTTYTYDQRDRLLSKATPWGTLTYSYDAAGNLLSIRSSNANGINVTYSYDELNRLAALDDQNLTDGVTTYAYDNAGNLVSYRYPNFVQHDYTYDPLNRLTNLSVHKGFAPLAAYAYTLGAAGNRLAVSELSGRTVTYAYDDLYRLTGETIASDPNGINGAIGYTYDAVGNRLERTSTVAPVPAATYAYDANDRLLSDSYDANGNTVTSAGKRYAYDFENRLVNFNNGEVTMLYDGDGNRVAKTVAGVTTNYLVDDRNLTGYAQVLEEIVGGVVQRQYTYGLDLVSQNQVIGGVREISFYGYDGQGSVRQMFDSAGVVTDHYQYDAFGNLIGSSEITPNDYRYTGEQNDSSLMMLYLRSRYTNLLTGRFWTMDSFEGNLQDPLSLHKYAYAGVNPVDHVDPSGRFFMLVELALVSLQLVTQFTLIPLRGFQNNNFAGICCGTFWNPLPKKGAEWKTIFVDVPMADAISWLTSQGYHETPQIFGGNWTRPRTYKAWVCGINTFRDNAQIDTRGKPPGIVDVQEQNYSGQIPPGEPNPEVGQSGPWPYPTWPAYVRWWHSRY